jgi:hypothetical protein
MVMRRRSIVVVVAVVSMVGLLSSPATAVSNYQISARSGATFLTLTSNSLFQGQVDDQVVKLSTSLGGARHMPFAVRFYGTMKSSMWVSTNGNVQFGTSASTAYANDCLPSSVIPGKLVAVFWDDLFVDTSVTGQGVFTKTQGSAPNRRFTISWQVVRLGTTDPVRAQLTFFESSNTIKMVYGQSGGASATIGVQLSSSTLWRQFSCNSGLNNTVFAGLRVDFIR